MSNSIHTSNLDAWTLELAWMGGGSQMMIKIGGGGTKGVARHIQDGCPDRECFIPQCTQQYLYLLHI